MIDGLFGAAVPDIGVFLQPDVVITPLVSFDCNGYRLGYGGGYYDRSFKELTAIKSVAAVGFAYSAQELRTIPTESTDHKLDALVTETKVLRF